MFSSNTLKSELANSKQQAQHASKDLSKEFKNFLTDIEDLFKETTSLSGEDLARAKAKFNDRLKSAKATVSETSETLTEQARKTAAATNKYVNERPWTAIGAGVAVSFLVGYLLASNRDTRD